MRKRILLFIAVISVTVGSAVFFHSCELDDCATCKQVTTASDGTETTGLTLVACGDELADKESQDPVTIGGTTTEWVCE